MFIRPVRVRSPAGTVHEYIPTAASVRQHGRIQQKLPPTPGRRDTLESVFPLLQRFLRGDDDHEQLAQQLSHDGPIEVLEASAWGPMLVARHLFAELGLWSMLDAGRRWPRLLPEEDPNDDWPSRVLALITNRLVSPGSEHALGAWLETDYVCDRHGRRYVPSWKHKGRGAMDCGQWRRWYRTLDHLLLNKETIEVGLDHRLRELFDFHEDLHVYLD